MERKEYQERLLRLKDSQLDDGERESLIRELDDAYGETVENFTSVQTERDEWQRKYDETARSYADLKDKVVDNFFNRASDDVMDIQEDDIQEDNKTGSMTFDELYAERSAY